MSKLLTIISLIAFSAPTFAKTTCTDQPKDKWMSVEDFKAMKIKEGFKIRKFKNLPSCYEIYGTDKNGQKVEIYFNPVDGTPVKVKLQK